MSEKKFLKKVAAAGAALLASAGLLINGAFTDPADIAKENAYVPAPIVTTVNTAASVDEEPEADTGEKKEKRSFSGILRAWILRLPLGLRVFVGIPLWAVGFCLSELGGFLFTKFISPNAGAIVRWLLIAAAFAGIFILLSRVLFPDKKLKEVLNGRTFTALTAGVVLLAILNGLVPLAWKDFEKYAAAFRAAGGAAVVTGLVITVLLPRKKKKVQ